MFEIKQELFILFKYKQFIKSYIKLSEILVKGQIYDLIMILNYELSHFNVLFVI